jgi:hypothetical protein
MAPEAMFAAVRLESDAGLREKAPVPTEGTTPTSSGGIEVEIGDATIRVPRGVDRTTLDAVIAALRGMR